MDCPKCNRYFGTDSSLDTHFRNSHPSEYRAIKRRYEDDCDDDFILSAAIAYMTDSAILGTVMGGSLTGALVGDMLNDSDSSYGDSNDYGSDDGGDFGGDD